MAFLAVIREGFETAVFLLAAFQSAISPVQAVLGVVFGVGAAVGLGYLIYRGGITLNLSHFFRFTGAVLVLVAGGLVMSTLRAAYEAGWLTVGQQPALDLSAIARPGSISVQGAADRVGSLGPAERVHRAHRRGAVGLPARRQRARGLVRQGPVPVTVRATEVAGKRIIGAG